MKTRPIREKIPHVCPQCGYAFTTTSRTLSNDALCLDCINWNIELDEELRRDYNRDNP